MKEKTMGKRDKNEEDEVREEKSAGKLHAK